MKYIFVSLMVTGGLLLACTSTSTQTETSATADTIAKDTSVSEVEISCYSRKTDKDTIMLVLQKTGESITGKLSYKIYEKDSNTGTLSGYFRNDTLRADYTFMSEGTESVREVIFLKRGDQLLEATGAMEDRMGKMVFSNRAVLQFPETLHLDKDTCEE